LGHGVGGEGLLGEGGPDDGQGAPVDHQVEGGDGAGFVAGAILEL
jgi:hypothetical protein